MKVRLIIYFLLLLSLRGYSQCTLNVTISQSAPAICSGNNITLTATLSGGTGPFSYVWNTGETTASINVNNANTYTVTVSDKTPGCQPVKSSLVVVGSSTPNAPTAQSVIVCPNTSATLVATAPGGTYQWYDQLGNFLASGDTYITPPLALTNTYFVETTLNGCTSARTPVFAYITGKPKVIPTTVCSGNVATLLASGGSSYTWYSDPNGAIAVGTGAAFTTPALAQSATYYVVAVINGCNSPITPVTATVSAALQPPTVANVTICNGSSGNLHASSAGGVINWYADPSGGTPLISSPDYTTPPLTATTTYYVGDSLKNCVSVRIPVTVTVAPIPVAPQPQIDTICYGTSTTLAASLSPSGSYQWYDAASGGNLLATGTTFTTPVLNNSITYYVQENNGGCLSVLSPISVIVKPPLSAPSASGAIICPGSTTTLTATGPGGNYSWYSAAVGGTLLGTGVNFTTPALNVNATYYVETNLGGCVSPRAAVSVSVLPSVIAPTSSNTSVCSGSSAMLTANSAVGTYEWYNSATGGNLLSAGQVYVTPALTVTTTYYVQAINNGCASSRTPVTVTINPVPQTPSSNGVTICPGSSATLTASAAGGTIRWYNSATGGSPLQTGNSYTTPTLTTNTTYYVENSAGQCVSARIPVTVTINSQFNPQFQYSAGTFCIASPNPTPVINNTAGGTFSAVPAGLVFISITTGQINIAASTPGTYMVSFAGNGACPGISKASISIVTTTDARFSYGGPYCQGGGTNPLPSFPAGGSGGNFSASPAGLVFVNTSTGEIDLGKSNSGTYTITNTIGASGGCAAATATGQVTINQGVVVNAGPSQTLKTGTPAQLAGSITGATSSGTWSGGAGSFSNPSIPNAVYTPGATETSALLTLTSANPGAPCGPVSSTVTLIFNSAPQQPTASGAIVCSGSGVILSATAPGGVYQWYDVPTGGSLLATGPNFTTPALTVNTTYYVQTTVGGVTSLRTPVTVNINPVPVPPVAPGVQVCAGSSGTLTASGATGTYEWYNAATGGNLLSTSNTYFTPALTGNISYYVQSVVNGCVSTRTQVDVTITPIPHVISAAVGIGCSGTPLNYTIVADQPTATFSWSRAQVAGISNPAVANQTSPIINETLINTKTTAVNVVYTITPLSGLCSGPAFFYIVTVYPTPVIKSSVAATICDMTTDNYTATFSMPVKNFSWSRAVVPGISNAPVSNQSAPTIREVLFNTTNAPIDVPYVLNYGTPVCNGTPFNFVITVNPQAVVTSRTTSLACSGFPQNYVITSNIPTATFSWSRNVAPFVSNPAVKNQTSGTITETLNNTAVFPVNVIYTIIPIANGCPGTPFNDTVTLNPAIPIPVANNSSPVCVGSTVHLRTSPISGATYLWTGPNGYQSTLQNADVVNAASADSGVYTLVVTVNGCSTSPVTTHVIIHEPPVANAGPDQVVCIANPSIFLSGSVTGGTTSGIWTTNGTGTFTPSNNTLNAQYIPSAADRAALGVVLILTSTSKDNCNISTDSVTIKFGPLPAVDAGPDQDDCSQNTSIPLTGAISIPGGGSWTTTGSGTFSPSASLLNANYLPSAADVQNGSVTLVLHAANPGVCFIPTDSMTIKFSPPPTLNAGGTRYVLRGRTITLNPSVSNNNVSYLWSPNIDINDVTAKNPIITGDINRTYILTVTDSRGCVSQDSTFIKVSPEIKTDNTFTPNGDGINDVWNITGLIAYVDATVDIFDRYGQKVFHSLGYSKPWDGTLNGKALPFGVYYYVINTNANGQVLSGYITIIR